MKTNNQSYKYFTPDEFAKCIPTCCIKDISHILLMRLDTARFFANVPFIITSAYRSKEYELSKGRSGSSSHCKGLAVDIKCNNDKDRLKILESLFMVGFKRIGIYETFIHVDIDKDKPECVWYGK